MDPFSVTVGALTLVSLSAACVKETGSLVRAFKHAPDEVLALSNEINDFHLVLSQVKTAIPSKPTSSKSTNSHNDDFVKALAPHLTRASATLIKFDQLLKELLVKSPTGESILQRHVWLRRRSKVKTLKEEFTEVKHSLCLLFAANSAQVALPFQTSPNLIRYSSRTARIELALQVPNLAYMQSFAEAMMSSHGLNTTIPIPRDIPQKSPRLAVPVEVPYPRGASPDIEKGNYDSKADVATKKLEYVSTYYI
jgi:hypothetical protein